LCQNIKQSFPMGRRAVFLDRDGVINEEKNFVLSPHQIELYPFSGEAVKKLNQAGYPVIVVTNQSAVARNYITIEQLNAIHNALIDKLKSEGAYLDGIYFCPHKGELDEEVGNKEYIHDCECRKPKPGMLFQAAEDFNIDLKRSYLIGDSERDIIAGKRAECITIGVRTGKGLNGMKESPDYIFNDLQEAVDFILGLSEQR
ncbi:MAG: HAD family hydrolase, partial [Bacteroidales bacterium]|nr:HAD family hydrolase [Bacteroidales bacterium]